MQKGKNLGLEEARMIVQAALDYAANTEGPAMAVAVVDRHSNPIYLERMEDASPVTARMCITKCYTALEVLRDTIDQRKVLEKVGLESYEFSSADYTVIPSGCLLKTKDGIIVGAVGSSGRLPLAPGGDEDVARAGVKAFEESKYFNY